MSYEHAIHPGWLFAFYSIKIDEAEALRRVFEMT